MPVTGHTPGLAWFPFRHVRVVRSHNKSLGLVEHRSSSDGQDASRATAQAILPYYLQERMQLCVCYLRSRLVQRNFSEEAFIIYENLLAFVDLNHWFNNVPRTDPTIDLPLKKLQPRQQIHQCFHN